MQIEILSKHLVKKKMLLTDEKMSEIHFSFSEILIGNFLACVCKGRDPSWLSL